MPHPKVSVVIPTFNRLSLLVQSVRSVAAAVHATPQSLLDLSSVEIAVVDDAHQSEVCAACVDLGDELGLEVKYFTATSGPRAGPSSARNLGILASAGEIIFLLDDDDLFLANRFTVALTYYRDPNVEVVLEPVTRFFDADPSRPEFETGPYVTDLSPFEFLLSGGERSHIAPAGTSFRRETYVRFGGYAKQLRFGEDSEMLLRFAAAAGTVMSCYPPVARIRIHTNNTSTPRALRLWHPLKALAVANRSPQIIGQHRHLLQNQLRGKLSFALTECRLRSPSYAIRLSSGLSCLRVFPIALLTRVELRSIVVWLLWGSKN